MAIGDREMTPIPNFKKIDNRYSGQEYKKLQDYAKSRNPVALISMIIREYFTSTEKYFFYYEYRRYRYISETLYDISKATFQTLYEDPLECMPLYINIPTDISSIAIWRLEIGK